MEPNKRGRNWLLRLRYLVLSKTPSDPQLRPQMGRLEIEPLNNQRLSNNIAENQTASRARRENFMAFRRNFTANSLENPIELARKGEQLRKSLRKWHRRMKNCFSKNTRSRPRHNTTGQPDSSQNSPRVHLEAQCHPSQNIYSVDPVKDRLISSNSDSASGDFNNFQNIDSPSRLQDFIPIPSPRTFEERRNPQRSLTPTQNSIRVLPLEPLRGVQLIPCAPVLPPKGSGRTPPASSPNAPLTPLRGVEISQDPPILPPKALERTQPPLVSRSWTKASPVNNGYKILSTNTILQPHSSQSIPGSPSCLLKTFSTSLTGSDLENSLLETSRALSPIPSPPFGSSSGHSSLQHNENALNEASESPEGPSRASPTQSIDEVNKLAYCTWYWGPAVRSQVEQKLAKCPDGSFLVRDSASDRHIFSISFRSAGVTLHSRIVHTSKSGYKLFDHDGYSTLKELIEDGMNVSKDAIYCYTKNNDNNMPHFPVRLLHPISRYQEVRTLQNLARFVIRQNVNLNDIDVMDLPGPLINYLKEEAIF